MHKKNIALVGNPNVGKSTLFNALTGMHQHTGNWPGKTVNNISGTVKYKDATFELIDLPGTYSLESISPDEMVTAEYIRSGKADIILIVADATCLRRNLILVRDILALTRRVVLCVNLIDEAEKKGICIDILKLQSALEVPVIAMSARSGKGLSALLESLHSFSAEQTHGVSVDPDIIYDTCVSMACDDPHNFDRKLDKIVTSKKYGFPIMMLLLMLIFWITMSGANYPSAALSHMFGILEEHLRISLNASSLPPVFISMILDGVYTTLTWVISVMLPPMAIFFPLFTLLEDFGYLPRVAFNLDNAFRKCGAHGKQSLTMCMGFGCNACGVMGCRIIESPRERLIAILTNSFVPCNGRFPTLIAMILVFFTAGISMFNSLVSGIFLTIIIIFSILMTLAVSKLLSVTLLKGLPSSFILELPPYRTPKFMSVIIRSVFDKTLFVLGRAIAVAAPSGLIIWILANVDAGTLSLLEHLTRLFDPLGSLIGVDGVILTAFLLGFPANEIVIPVMLMCYMSLGTLTEYSNLSQLSDVLTSCGWTPVTALCVIILCLFHFPCGTTCLTIKKETGSLKWTALAFALPTAVGISICFIINMLAHLFA